MSNYVKVEHSWDLDSYIECRGCGWGTYRTPAFAHDTARRHATLCPSVRILRALEPPC